MIRVNKNRCLSISMLKCHFRGNSSLQAQWVQMFSNSGGGYKSTIPPILFLCFFFASSSLLFLPLALPWHSLWHELCMTIINGGSKGKSPFQLPIHLSFTLLTLTSSINTFLFLSRFNRMTTDIGFLEAGLGGHGVRLDTGRNRLRKNGKTLAMLLKVHSLFHCRLYSHCTLERHYSLVQPLWTLPQTLLAPPTSSTLLHSVAHYFGFRQTVASLTYSLAIVSFSE
jgi:hypothetical protein